MTTTQTFDDLLKRKPMTNADRIRNMSDEELKSFLENYEFNQCEFCNHLEENCDNTKCGFYILEWLHKESEV